MLELSMVFAALAAWAALYVYVVRPKLEAYRHTAGIYRKLDEVEAGSLAKIRLRFKGAKVALIGLVASAIPVLGPVIAQLDGVDWTKILPTEKAQVVVAVLGFVSATLPLGMIVLHQLGLVDAARMKPCEHDHDHDGE